MCVIESGACSDMFHDIFSVTCFSIAAEHMWTICSHLISWLLSNLFSCQFNDKGSLLKIPLKLRPKFQFCYFHTFHLLALNPVSRRVLAPLAGDTTCLTCNQNYFLIW